MGPFGYLLTLTFITVLATGIEEQYYFRPTICGGSATTPYKTILSFGRLVCATKCREDEKCLSFRFNAGECYLGETSLATDCSNARANPGGIYYEMEIEVINPCKNGGYLEASTCSCVGGYIGPTCETIMKDCSEGFQYSYYSRHSSDKMVMKIHPALSPDPFEVKCWFVHGGRTYIQHRDDDDVDFARSWNDYANGFGNINGNYWLGLQKIYYLTNSEETRLEYESFDKDFNYHQEYVELFKIGLASTNYAVLTVSAEYGGLGQCMTETLGKPFSTQDNRNNAGSENCADRFKSGWWFGATCTSCNPNGPIVFSVSGTRLWMDEEAFWKDDNHSPYGIYMWLVDPY